MLNVASLTVLIAEGDSRLESLAGGFRKSRAQFNSGDLIVFLICLLGVFVALWLVSRWSERRVRRDSSLGLFCTLAKAHCVNWADLWLLWRIARAKRLPEPAVIFLDPRLTSPQFVNHLAPPAALRLKALRRRFFLGIDQESDLPRDSVTAVGDPPHPALQEIPATTTLPAGHVLPPGATGDLAEALNAIKALNLQEQLAQAKESEEQPPPELKKAPATPTPEFPSSEAPVLDLYPWLGNDWEITNTDD